MGTFLCRRTQRSQLNTWHNSTKRCGYRLVQIHRCATSLYIANKLQGNLTELMGDLDNAVNAYEQALRHNQYSIQAMNAISCILRTKENFPRAVEYLQAILKLDSNNGEVWGSLGMSFFDKARPFMLTRTNRPLFPHDGGLAAGVFCVSTSIISS